MPPFISEDLVHAWDVQLAGHLRSLPDNDVRFNLISRILAQFPDNYRKRIRETIPSISVERENELLLLILDQLLGRRAPLWPIQPLPRGSAKKRRYTYIYIYMWGLWIYMWGYGIYMYMYIYIYIYSICYKHNPHMPQLTQTYIFIQISIEISG
jgi:hypothetical protein